MIKELELQIQIEEPHPKVSFWASDAERDKFSIYHTWKGTKPTNPFSAQQLIKFAFAKHAELAIMEQYAKMGVLEDKEKVLEKGFVISSDNQYKFGMEREGIIITGKPDGMFKGMIPLEIKTHYEKFTGQHEGKLEAGRPSTNYLKQLAANMDFIGAEKGILQHFNIGSGRAFEFELLHLGDKRYRCNDIEFDMKEEYKRYAVIKQEYIDKDIEPESDFRYKHPLDRIKWEEYTRSQIGMFARNDKVCGDWQVLYSPYKDLIVAKEGTEMGYTAKELEYIQKVNNYKPRT